MPHTWIAKEKRNTKRFAEWISERNLTGLENARGIWRAGNPGEVIDSMAHSKQDLSRVATDFRASKDNIVDFFRDQRALVDLYATKLRGAPAPQLKEALVSYFTDVSLIQAL